MLTVQDAMALMFQRGKANMSTDDLEGLASLTDYAADEARRLSAVCEGLGCLISYDGRNPTGAGNFWDGEDVSTLLFALGHSFDVLAAMVHVGDEANFEAGRRNQRGYDCRGAAKGSDVGLPEKT